MCWKSKGTLILGKGVIAGMRRDGVGCRGFALERWKALEVT